MSTQHHSIEAKASRNLERMAAHPEMGYFRRLLSSDEISSGFALGYTRFLMDSEELMADLDRARIARALHLVETRGYLQELSRRALAIAVNVIREFTLPGSARRSHLNRILLSQLDDHGDSFAVNIAKTFDGDEELASLFGLEPLAVDT